MISQRAWLLSLRNQALGFIREPAAAVFNLAVPLMIVVVQATAFGDQPLDGPLKEYSVIDVLGVAACVMCIMIIGIFGMSIGLASMMETRTLAGAKLRPGGLGGIVGPYIVVVALMIILGLVIANGVLILFWDSITPAHLAAVIGLVLLGSVGFLGLGTFVAGVVGSPRGAQGLSSIIFFPMLFLSGSVFTIDYFPESLQKVAMALPGYHLYEALGRVWVSGMSIPWGSILYLVCFAVICWFVAALVLRRREDT